MKETFPVFQNPGLEGGTINFEGNTATGVLLIHGFTATTAEVKWLADAFAKMGFSVSAPLLPGHGTAPHDLNRQKYQDWTRCVEHAYYELDKKCERIIVGGESMGAVLSLYLAEKHPGVSALLIYSPAIHVKSLKYARYLKWIKPIINKASYDKDDKTWQGYSVYPLKAAHEFNKLQARVEKNLAEINHPALILQGIFDKTIDKDCGKFIFNAISSRQKEFQLLQNSGHVMLLGQEFERIIQLTVEFLKGADIL